MSDFLDPSFHRGIFRVTDRLRQLSINPASLTVSDYSELLSEMCGAFRQSLDHGLERAVEFGGKLRNDPGVAAEANAILRDAGAFASFCAFEEKVLVECGAQPETATAIVTEVRALRERLAGLPYDESAIKSALHATRSAACQAASEAGDALAAEMSAHAMKKRTSVTYGTGLTIANASIAMVTWGGTAPLSGLSLAAGGLLITYGTTTKSPGDRRPGLV